METCTEDRHCASRSCNTEAGQCRTASAAAGETCEASVGCVDALTGEVFSCVASRCGPPCVRACEAAKLCADATVEEKRTDCAAECKQGSDAALAAGCGVEFEALMLCTAGVDLCIEGAQQQYCGAEFAEYLACSFD